MHWAVYFYQCAEHFLSRRAVLISASFEEEGAVSNNEVGE